MRTAQKHRPPFTHFPDGQELYMDEDDYAILESLDRKLRTNGFGVIMSEVLIEDGEVEAAGFVATLVWPTTTSLTHHHLRVYESKWKMEALDRFGGEYSVSPERREFDPQTGLNFLRRVVTG